MIDLGKIKQAKKLWPLLGLGIFVLFLFLLDLFIGSVKIPVFETLKILVGKSSFHSEWEVIIFSFRIPRALTAILAGMALSVSGLQMQTVFRNPLAGPYVLGISSGASLGVAILVLGFSSILFKTSSNMIGDWTLVLAASFGSALILLLIFAVSVRIKDIMTILILGILFGSIASALVGVMQYFSNESLLKSFVVWSMGSLGNITKDQIQVLSIVVLIGLLISFGSVKILNALLLGEDYAKTLGINIKTTRAIVFLSTSILAGSVTAFCGPIGFIGIVVPHLGRMLFRTSNHSFLMPGSIIIGSGLMLISDMISQLPGSEKILPINSITALLGIPIIIWIIIKRKRIIQ